MPILTKALQKTAPDQPYRVAQIARRDPRPHDVVIAIRAAGICHSDIHTIRDEWGRAPFPLTVGHEIAGVVEAVGDAVTSAGLDTRNMGSATKGRSRRCARRVGSDMEESLISFRTV